MPLQTKATLQTEGFKIYVVGGVALVLAVLWWLAPGDELKPMPMGRQEQAYREEVDSLFGAEAASACEYWSKHLYITCGTVQVNESLLTKRGWQPSSQSGGFRWYTKERWRMKLQCAQQSPEACTLEIWPTKG
jgi:hypothetical protein